jgi:hypothetical protein
MATHSILIDDKIRLMLADLNKGIKNTEDAVLALRDLGFMVEADALQLVVDDLVTEKAAIIVAVTA